MVFCIVKVNSICKKVNDNYIINQYLKYFCGTNFVLYALALCISVYFIHAVIFHHCTVSQLYITVYTVLALAPYWMWISLFKC